MHANATHNSFLCSVIDFVLTHMDSAGERLTLREHSVAIGQVGDRVLAGLVVGLVDGQVRQGLSRISGNSLVGRSASID